MPDDSLPAIPSGDADPITNMLMRAATDPHFDAQKFEVAVRFMVDREDKANLRAFNRAMERAQANMQTVDRDGRHLKINFKYSTLDAMLKVILPAITPEGLSVRFGTQPPTIPGNQCVTCIVSHRDGHQEVVAIEASTQETTGVRGGQMQMNDLQAVGSTITYLKRYALGMAFTLILADEQDDDGQARSPGGKPVTVTPPRDVKPEVARGSDKFPSLHAQLARVPDTDALARFAANERFVAFRDGQTRGDDRLIEAMLAARRSELEEAARAASEAQVQAAREAAQKAQAAQAAAAPADFEPEGEAEEKPPAAAAGPSALLLGLLRRVASCQTTVALDSCIAAPEFVGEIVKLTPTEGAQLDAAIKTRATQLEGTTS